MTESLVRVPLPESLDEIAQDFAALSARDRLTLLLDFSDGLPELPERYAGHTNLLERVDECQTPLFLGVEVKSPQDPAALQEGNGAPVLPGATAGARSGSSPPPERVGKISPRRLAAVGRLAVQPV
jgi:sulfur transfer protein SufE